MRSRGRREIGLPAPALDRIASDFPLPFRERVGVRVNVLGRDLPAGGRRPPRRCLAAAARRLTRVARRPDRWPDRRPAAPLRGRGPGARPAPPPAPAAAGRDAAPGAVHNLTRAEVAAFLDFAAAISEGAWPEASLYFQRGPDLLRGVEAGQRGRYLQLSTRVPRRLGRQAYVLFAEGGLALREVAEERHGRLIDLAEGLVGLSPQAAMAFLKSAPVLAERLRPGELGAG